jgi:hypothetical protein
MRQKPYDRGADLRLCISPQKSRLVLTGERTRDGQSLPSLQLPWNAPTAARDRASALLAFRRKISSFDLDDSTALSALTALREDANQFAWHLLGGKAPVRELRAFCVGALGPWRGERAEPPLVEIETPPDLLFPFELLPVAGLPTDEPAGDALEQRAAQFLGLAAVVRRLWSVPHGGLPALRRGPSGLPVAFFRDADLGGAAEEQRALEGDDRINLQFVWPSHDIEQRDAVETLSRRLVYPRDLLGTGPADEVQHFACHCMTEGSTSSWHLKLRPTKGGSSVHVALKSLQSELIDLTETDEPMPFVFFNACGSAGVDVFSASSFVQLFIQNGNRGFVGTETRVPDSFAAKFSGRFYRELLNGQPVGIALHRARWSMLLHHRNPLGILYTLYGDPGLTIG